MRITDSKFSRWLIGSVVCAVLSIAIWVKWAGPNAENQLSVPVFWMLCIAAGMIAAWRAMLYSSGDRQELASGGIFMFHVFLFFMLLFNVWGIGTGK